jgi:phosphoribosylamine--glycine ligase
MRVLLLGAGGREHAFAWKISQSPLCENFLLRRAMPVLLNAEPNLDFGVNDFDAIRKCCIDEKIDLVLVGPEEPLVKGITDFLISDPQLKDFDIIGPSKMVHSWKAAKHLRKPLCRNTRSRQLHMVSLH